MENTTNQQQKCFELLHQLSELLDMEQTCENLDKQEETIKNLEVNLIFNDKKTHEKWLNVLQSFKFWEDFEELTTNIINQIPIVEFKNKIIKDLDGLACDFIIDNDIENDSDIYDLFWEYADNNVSVYYCDQKKYYNEHSDQCEEDFLELYDEKSICEIIKEEGLEGLICKVGAVGEFCENQRTLDASKKAIVQVLLINYYFDNIESYDDVDPNKIIEIIDDIHDGEFDTFSDYLEQFNNNVEELR